MTQQTRLYSDAPLSLEMDLAVSPTDRRGLIKQSRNGVKPPRSSRTLPFPSAELVLDLRLQQGGGCLWNGQSQTLYFVDAVGKAIHEYDPVTHHTRESFTTSAVTALVPRARGGMIVATAGGLLSFSPDSRQMRHLVFPLPAEQLTSRFLGVACDPAGRMWSVAGKTPGRSDSGGLYCFAAGDVPRKIPGLELSGDGLIWDREGYTLYCADTAAQRIDAYFFDRGTGELIKRRTVITFPPGHDGPKGGAIDVEGKIWIAHWRGGCVSRWDPHTGRCLGRVEVPAPGVTSCTFGGENLTTLFITTSREGIDPEMLEIWPRSGGLFACRPGVAGIPAHGFAD